MRRRGDTFKMKIIVTGGAGFIGSNFIRYWLDRYSNDEIVNLDALTYAGRPENLTDISERHGQRYRFVQADIADEAQVTPVLESSRADLIVNFAAESHNSLAIVAPGRFFRTNVIGTQTLLEASRRLGVARFHHISTCEVYGDLDLDSSDMFSEESPYRPRTPYNASKAGADMAVRAYFETFSLPVTISNCCNNYGPYQYPEKLIPLFTTNLLDNIPVPIYRQSQNRREWLHVLDHCRAIDAVIRRGRAGETYNVGSGIEKSVEEITELLLRALGKSDNLKRYVEDRPGHDRRYLLDSRKIRSELGWSPEVTFEGGLQETIEWYRANPAWWRPLKTEGPVREDAWGKRT